MIEFSPKAVFFDLDDTLCTYWDAAKTGLKTTFTELTPAPHTPKDLMHAWVLEFRLFCPHLAEQDWREKYWEHGETTRTELMRRALRRLDAFNEDLAQELSARYFEVRQASLVLFPDAQRILDRLVGKYPLGLITNGPGDIQRLELARLGLEDKFQYVFIEGELKFGKPDPRVFQLAESQSGCLAADILFIGNSLSHDIRPAAACGWKTAWVRRPSDVPPSANDDSQQEPIPTEGIMPDAIIESLDQLQLP